MARQGKALLAGSTALRAALEPGLSLLVLLALVAFGAQGCNTVDKQNHFSNRASFGPESQRLWTRPSEYAYETLGTVTGNARVVKVIGIPIEGDDATDAGIPILSSVKSALSDDTDDIAPLIRVAAADAISQVENADGIYITQTIDKNGPLPFPLSMLYSRHEVTIKGKALRLKDLGMVDVRRADTERFLRALPAGTGLQFERADAAIDSMLKGSVEPAPVGPPAGGGGGAAPAPATGKGN